MTGMLSGCFESVQGKGVLRSGIPRSLAGIVLLSVWGFAGLASAQVPSGDSIDSSDEEATFFDPEVRDIKGWTVHVDPELLDGEGAELGARSLSMLSNHLERIAILVPAGPLEKLRTVEIWIEMEHASLSSMQYHPSRRWLESHACDPRLARKVHIPKARDLVSRAQMLKHPAVILHELAHAYHDQVIGFDEPSVIEAFRKAQEAGTYEKVMQYDGREVRHYGLTNHKEYFAEGTEAYFYRNDFFPFVHGELKAHDPALYRALQAIWGDVR